ncbi:MAG: HAD hydrolase-like protein, partial [Actinomycetota bacterium]|nr:HAD hydrolase-like protein [Actinomycetota bacterium]
GLGRPAAVPGSAAHAAAPAAVMVGDRAQDVNGARGNALDCVGVSWGFGLPGELEAAGAVAVVDHADALLAEIRHRLASMGRLRTTGLSAGRGIGQHAGEGSGGSL